MLELYELTITIENKRNERISLEGPISERVVLRNCTGCRIENETFRFNGRGDMLQLRNCVDCKVLRCTFRGKNRKGNFIHIQGKDSRDNLIEGCSFLNHTFNEGNGGEAIIVGDNVWSGCRFKTTIRKCEFINCRGDDEIVSIKSCDNVFENNRIDTECDGNITIRHGGFNKILNNVFEGSAGGIRVYGNHNEIRGNYHKNNNNGNLSRRPLLIENGDEPFDANIPNGEPIGEPGEDEDYDGYASVRNNRIEDNIYENCRGIIVVWGREDEDEKPQGNTFSSNTLIADNDANSEFVSFENANRNQNTFEDNKMFGRNARRGDLRESEVQRLDTRPEIPIPDAGP
jgi:hypothetical protein